MMMKAFSYLRVSGKGQVLGDGFPRQRESISTYANANGIAVQAEFRDEGISGTTELADRDGLGDLIDRIESDDVRTVLVERSDRIARDLLVGEVILGQFRDLGVTVIEAASGNVLTADDGDPTKVLIRQILGAVAQFDKSVVVSKLRAARDRMRRNQGRCEGRKPFGSFAGEEEIFNQIVTMRKSRKGQRRTSYRRIAESLNSQGIRSRCGKPWNGTTIRNMVARRTKL
ncbi:MAG: recombinase family protein [Planctomycetes bacterium]|nr:recombinase family protein [Planctomycetota bacterium]